MNIRTPSLIVIILCFAFSGTHANLAQTADEPALRSLVEKFFVSFQNEELDSLMSLWSPQSPDRQTSRQSFQGIFTRVDKIQIKNLTISRLTLDAGRASVRVACEMTAVDAKTGTPAAGFGRVNRTF